LSTLLVGTRLSLPGLTMIITLPAGTTYLSVGNTTLPALSLPAKAISNLGYKSVAHYLIQTRWADLNSEKNEKTWTQTKWSLPFSSEKVEPEDGVAKSDNMKFEDGIATNEVNRDEKPTELQISDEPLSVNEKLKVIRKLKTRSLKHMLMNILDLKNKNMELEEIDSEDGVPTNNACKVENPTKLQSSPVDKATNPEELKLKANNLEDTICISALNGCGLDEFCNAVQEKLKDSMVWAMAELDALLWEGRKQKLARALLCPHIAPPVGVGGSFGSILQYRDEKQLTGTRVSGIPSTAATKIQTTSPMLEEM
ncbi:hypothetical protein Tco_0832734, partial [Tanacetum coccineum]